jgi:hypothetical protein
MDVLLPVILENARAVTRDASTSGVYFRKRGTFMYGDSIRFSIERETATGRILQKCRGVVVRTEPDDEGVGIAARIIESTTEPMPGSPGGTESHEPLREPPLEPPRVVVEPRQDAPAPAIKPADRPSAVLPTRPREASEEPGTDAAAPEASEEPLTDTKAPEASEESRTAARPGDDALAPAIETVHRWSSLLRKKALDACEELQAQDALEWDFPSIADAAIMRSGRVRVCSVIAVDLVSKASRGSGHGGLAGDTYHGPDLPLSKGEIDARRSAGDVSELMSWRRAQGGAVRIDLEACLAGPSRGDPVPHRTPLPRVLVRMTSVRDDNHLQEIEKDCFEQGSYSDPARAFEAFLALAVEIAILMNLAAREEAGAGPLFRSAA